MNNYANIYSEYGLKQLIENTKEKIKQSKKEYQEVCEGKRYNPLCADEWKRVIQSDINRYENDIKKYEEALEIQRSKRGVII